MMRGGFRMDPSVTKQKLKPGTIKRIAGYARPYRWKLTIFLLATALDAVITVVNPLLLRQVIDHGILARNDRVVVLTAVAVALQGANQLEFAHLHVGRIGQQRQGLGFFLGLGMLVDALQRADQRFLQLIRIEHVVGDFAQRHHGVLVVVAIDEDLPAGRDGPRPVRREQHDAHVGVPGTNLGGGLDAVQAWP